uniref:NADH dehydrogenase subunit 3 n=1 Tax=Suva longipenna TaxID=3081115 RepID=UPI002A7FE977|nr:NADH dehydrogenase subunit 3 [Suva longipenna]WOW98937.1 NADH dehydrogenase subunit 3 [Suva longipenna]
MKILNTGISMMMILLIMFILTTKLSKKKKSSREKSLPFECGFSPFSSARKPFSIQFFLMAMMFLIFDIEISMILPTLSTKMINLKEWLMFTTIMLMILILGLMHEWKNGMLEWKK